MAIEREVDDGVARVTMARPEKLNALDLDHLVELRSALSELSADEAVRVIVLTGAGGRAFSTGVDISNRPGESTRSVASAFPLDDTTGGAAGIYTRLVDIQSLRIRTPLIAAVDGYCLGGGFELALQCDLLVASDRSSFGLPETGLASLPGAGGVRRLLRSVPRAIAMQMILTSERIDAHRAFEVGLVSRIFSPEDFDAGVNELARKLADGPPMSLALAKMLATHAAGLDDVAAQQLTELAWGMLRDTSDRAEGAQAFAEKRPPRFEGR